MSWPAIPNNFLIVNQLVCTSVPRNDERQRHRDHATMTPQGNNGARGSLGENRGGIKRYRPHESKNCKKVQASDHPFHQWTTHQAVLAPLFPLSPASASFWSWPRSASSAVCLNMRKENPQGHWDRRYRRADSSCPSLVLGLKNVRTSRWVLGEFVYVAPIWIFDTLAQRARSLLL